MPPSENGYSTSLSGSGRTMMPRLMHHVTKQSVPEWTLTYPWRTGPGTRSCAGPCRPARHAHREYGAEAARLRQEITTLRTELARPWWRRLIRR